MSLSVLDWSFLEASRIFVAFSDTGEYLERCDVAISSCGLPVEELNWGYLKPPYEDLGSTASAVRSYFEKTRLPYRLAFRAGDVDPAPLESLGWRLTSEPTPGMTCALPASAPAAPPSLAVREVCAADELVGFREAAFRGFGFPVAAAHIFLGERLLGLPHVRLFAGSVGDAVVSTSLLVATGPVAGIYFVATLEEHRGRGYGEALTWTAMAAGREHGCVVASLQASDLGRPVYERMGFEHVLDYAHLHPPED